MLRVTQQVKQQGWELNWGLCDFKVHDRFARGACIFCQGPFWVSASPSVPEERGEMIIKLSPGSDVRASWGVGGYWKAKGVHVDGAPTGVDRQEVI